MHLPVEPALLERMAPLTLQVPQLRGFPDAVSFKALVEMLLHARRDGSPRPLADASDLIRCCWLLRGCPEEECFDAEELVAWEWYAMLERFQLDAAELLCIAVETAHDWLDDPVLADEARSVMSGQRHTSLEPITVPRLDLDAYLKSLEALRAKSAGRGETPTAHDDPATPT